MKYFVTGATGFIGNALTRQLLTRGDEVHAIVRDPEKASELGRAGVHLYRGDIIEKESMRAAMLGTDGIFHVAGWYKIGARDKSPGERINVQGTRNVLELMKELRIPKGVYTSTLAVNSDTHGRLVDEAYHFEGKHLSEYDRSKAAAHSLAKKMIAAGLPLIIVMPGLVYGPGDTSSLRTNFTDYLRRRLPMIPGRTTFCWAHVEDIAAAHFLAMEKGKVGEAYIIAGEVATLVESFRMAEEFTGIPAPATVSPKMIAVLAGVMSLVEKIIPVPASYSSEGLRAIAGVTYIGDDGKARRELGFEPRSLREGLRATLSHEMALLGGK